MRNEPVTVAFRLTVESKARLRRVSDRYGLIDSLDRLITMIVLGDQRERPRHMFGPGTFVVFKAYGVSRVGCVVKLNRTTADIRYQTLSDVREWAVSDYDESSVPSRVTRRSLADLEQWMRPIPWWWVVHEMRRDER